MEATKRKHYTQMNDAETAAIIREVRKHSYTLGEHAIDRMNQKNVLQGQINAMLGYGKVVECHNNIGNEIRVLMRGKVAGKWCNAVISLTTKKIVTTWWNELNDHHKTLDKTQYRWTVDLKTVI